jgi:hypothetical protein
MLVPTINLITVSDIWSTTIQDRLLYHNIVINVSAVVVVVDAVVGDVDAVVVATVVVVVK